ncbi:hypothetical protein IBTHAUMO2_540003 [Nitrosopumilaceae archaeon]|nr:hypothetical protein IBTHAUMO2_540003 [Nitrosopumilaceae archaeon]
MAASQSCASMIASRSGRDAVSATAIPTPLKRASEDDLEDPINGAVLGDMSYEDHAANEKFQKKLDGWR